MTVSTDDFAIREFRCPACRARQPRQTHCRRCAADLQLLVKIHQRIDYLLTHPSDEHREELLAIDPGLSID